MLRKLLVLIFGGAILGSFLASNVSAQEKIKIGIVRYSDELGYPEGEKGVIEQLKTEGFDESNVVFDSRNAENSKEKVAAIAKEFVEKKIDMIVALGSSAAAGVYKETKDIPIICAIVFDPLGIGIAKTWENSGTNVTGSSSFVGMSSIIVMLKAVCPAKRIGILYNSGEKNSVLQVEELFKLKEKMDIQVFAVDVAKTEDAAAATSSLVGQVDSIFISGSSTVGKGLSAILEVANKAKIVTVAHTQDKLEKGVFMTISADSAKLGKLAGTKAAQVLRGTKPTDIPIEYLKTYDLSVNMRTAEAIGLKEAAERLVLKGAVKVIR